MIYSKLKKNVRAHEQVYKAVGGDKTGTSPDTHATQPEGQRNISEEEVATADKDTAIDDTFQNVEQVSSAALAPVNPSFQDLLVATSADAHLQQIQAKKT